LQDPETKRFWADDPESQGGLAFIFESEGDKNGVLYHIGTKSGTETFANPMIMKVTAFNSMVAALVHFADRMCRLHRDRRFKSACLRSTSRMVMPWMMASSIRNQPCVVGVWCLYALCRRKKILLRKLLWICWSTRWVRS